MQMSLIKGESYRLEIRGKELLREKGKICGDDIPRILQMRMKKHMDNRPFLLYNKGKTVHTQEKLNG
jgi:hypothetical protein